VTITRRSSTSERVATDLRRAIRQGELLPGEHVRQEEWADRLGVSRVPVREALKILAAEQLVFYDTHRGYFVTKIAASEMVQIYRMRMLLEPDVLRSLTWPGQDELARLQTQVDRAAEAMARRDIQEAMEIDREFYFFIYDLSPLRYIVAEVKRLWIMSDGYRSASMLGDLRTDPSASAFHRRHHDMVRALRRHDHKSLVSIVLRERQELLERLGGATGVISGTAGPSDGERVTAP
jgi:DNA-binding GntR family transcriptional regulator